MKFLKVKIKEYASHDQPGFVLCVFEDAHGETWEIIEKIPVLSSTNFQREHMPIEGFYVAGEVVYEDGNIVCFDTKQPWGISTDDGKTTFYVKKHQLSEKSSDGR